MHIKKSTHLENPAADVPAAAVTPDPKLSVVVALTVRYPIPVKQKGDDPREAVSQLFTVQSV